MKLNKMILTGLAVGMTLTMFTGCGSSKVATTQTKTETTTETEEKVVTPKGRLRTGVSMNPSISGSSNASEDKDGVAQMDMTFVSVTIDDEEVIQSCAIDGLQVNVSFNTMGELTTDLSTVFQSKNALGKDYGMHQASSIGKEWNEQAKAMAEYAVGKTVEEIKGMAVTENGAPAEADLSSSVTIYVGNFISGIEDAVNHALNQ